MAVIVNIRGFVAKVNNGKWDSDEIGISDTLSIFDIDMIRIYTPWPDYTLAEMACKALGGKIISATDPPEYVEGRVY